MYFKSFPDLDFPSALTSTNAGDTESNTASHSEQIKEMVKTNRKDNAISAIWSS